MNDRESQRIRAGEHAAFDRLFDEHGARVMGYLVRLTGSRSDAEDLTQETFLAAYASCATWQGRSQPLAWLLGIAWRRWRDRSRKPSIATEPLVTDVPARSDLAETVSNTTVLRQALDQLDARERDVLLLTAVEGLTFVEAARVLGEPVGTVKWRAHQAVRRLRELMNPAEGTDETPGIEGRILPAQAGPTRRR